MKRKLIALLTAGVLAVSMIPAAVYADCSGIRSIHWGCCTFLYSSPSHSDPYSMPRYFFRLVWPSLMAMKQSSIPSNSRESQPS